MMITIAKVYANDKKDGGKYLSVVTDKGEKFSCFVDAMFASLQEGKSVNVKTAEKGKWKNILGFKESTPMQKFIAPLDESLHATKEDARNRSIRYGNALNAMAALFAGTMAPEQFPDFIEMVDKAANYLEKRSTDEKDEMPPDFLK